MISEFLDTLTQTVRGWWMVLADNPWLALLCAVLAVALLPAMGFGIGRLTAKRPAPVIAGDKAAAGALVAVQAERDRHRAAAEAARRDLEAAQRQQKAAETARTEAEAARRSVATQSDEARRQVADAEAARRKAEAALAAVQTAALEAEAARAALTETVATLTARAEAAEAAIQRVKDEASAQLAEAQARADAAVSGAAQAAADAAAAADKAAAEAQARAEEQAGQAHRAADALVAEATARADAAIAAAMAEAAEAWEAANEARARAETAEASLDAASDARLRAAAATAMSAVAPLSDAVAAGNAYLAHHARGLVEALRVRALAALDGSAEGFDQAAAELRLMRALATGADGALTEDDTVLSETLAAARVNPALVSDPAKAEAAGLPLLAEVLWRNRAEAAEDGAAMAAAASAALWGGRWPQAAALAGRAVVLLDGRAEPAELLAVRLTALQAVLFSGAPGAVGMAEALAEDAASALGDKAPLTYDARRLLARALFEAGDADSAEDVVASLVGGPIDPTVDPVIRASRGRGLQVSGDAEAARRLFDALARQAGEGKRSGLGHRLDALEAAFAAEEHGEDILPALDALAPKLAAAFGARHPRLGQAALLRAMALRDVGQPREAAAALASAEKLLAPRLDPAHRWRAAAATLADELAQMADAPEVMEQTVEPLGATPVAADTPGETVVEGAVPAADLAVEEGETEEEPRSEPAPQPAQSGPWGAYGGGSDPRG